MNNDEVRDLMLESIPPPEEIEKLLDGRCHHGRDVSQCQECFTGRLFEATIRNAAEALGCPSEESDSFAAGALELVRKPQCSHIGCELAALWRGTFRLELRGAGELSGTYNGEISGGGLCQHHRNGFDPEKWKRAVVENVCKGAGLKKIPPGARWTGTAQWTTIIPAEN